MIVDDMGMQALALMVGMNELGVTRSGAKTLISSKKTLRRCALLVSRWWG